MHWDATGPDDLLPSFCANYLLKIQTPLYNKQKQREKKHFPCVCVCVQYHESLEVLAITYFVKNFRKIGLAVPKI